MRSRIVALFLSLFSMAATGADVRVRPDDLRGRTWVLRADALYLHDPGTGVPARRFALPGWVYVTPRFACEPDLVVEPGGAVLVSSNIVPSLWRVDPQDSSTTVLKIDLDPESVKDLGFTSLQWVEPGVMQANGSTERSRWRIDLANRRAVKLEGSAWDCE
jgi:hypothetical protein